MSKPKEYDSTDAKQVKNAKRDAKILENKKRNGLLKIMNDPDCRYALASFLSDAKVFQPAFSEKPTQHAFNEGFRNAGLWWMTELLLADPTSIARLHTDHDSPLKVENNDDGRSSSNASTDDDTDTGSAE